MDIGIFGFIADIESARAELAQAASDGFASYWIPQAFGPDTLTVIALTAADSAPMRVGTAVVPTYPRHPQMLAQQALTTNLAVDGRLVLGIGPSHKVVIEGQWGMSFDKPIRHMREYLEILNPMLTEQSAKVTGETLTARAQISVPGAPAPAVMVSALGPQLLKVAGRLCDGTITWMTGPNTVQELTVPTMSAAAEAAGRDAPEFVVGVPVCITDDVEGNRQRASKSFAMYGTLPSYRAMLDREGYEGPEDICLIGSEDEVGERIKAFEAAGTTTFAASRFGSRDDRARTTEFLKTLV